MSDLNATTTVTVRLDGRRATIADVTSALDILTTEGIPATFDISIDQRENREYIKDVPAEERPVSFSLVVSAERASKRGLAS